MNLLSETLDFTEQSILVFILKGSFSFAHGLISLVIDKVFLPFVQTGTLTPMLCATLRAVPRRLQSKIMLNSSNFLCTRIAFYWL